MYYDKQQYAVVIGCREDTLYEIIDDLDKIATEVGTKGLLCCMALYFHELEERAKLIQANKIVNDNKMSDFYSYLGHSLDHCVYMQYLYDRA